MNGEQPSGRDRVPGDDGALVDALRRLGDEHEPDSAAIWARIDPNRARDENVVRLDGRRDRHPRSGGRGPRRPALVAGLAAASVLGVLAVGQAFVRGVPVDPAPVAQSPSLTATTAPSSSVASEPTTSPAIGDPAATQVSRSPDARTTTVSRPPSPTGTGRPSADGQSPSRPSSTTTVPSPEPPESNGRVSVVQVGDSLLRLGTSLGGYLDWTVPNRGDGQAVWAKRPIGGRGFDVVAPAGAVVTSSPLTTEWVDGLPEQTGRTTAWLVAQPGGRWAVTVHGYATDRYLLVRVGNSLGVSAAVSGPDGSWSTNASFDAPKVVVVRIPASSGTTTVSLTGDAEDGLAVSSFVLQAG